MHYTYASVSADIKGLSQNEIVYLKAIESYIRSIWTTFVWKVFQESSLLHNDYG